MIEELRIRPPLIARPSTGLLEMLGLFQEAEIHMAFISEDPAETRKCIENRKRPSGSAVVLGVLTLEDVLEKILQYDIFDESDLTRRQTKNGTMTSTQLLRQSSGRVRRPSLSQISSLHVDDTSTPAEANNLKQNEECDENTELLNGKLRQSYSENKIENLRKLGNTNNLHQVDEIDLENNRYRTGSVDDNFIDDCNSLLSKSQQIIGSRSITGNRLDIENTDYSKMINRN